MSTVDLDRVVGTAENATSQVQLLRRAPFWRKIEEGKKAASTNLRLKLCFSKLGGRRHLLYLSTRSILISNDHGHGRRGDVRALDCSRISWSAQSRTCSRLRRLVILSLLPLKGFSLQCARLPEPATACARSGLGGLVDLS